MIALHRVERVWGDMYGNCRTMARPEQGFPKRGVCGGRKESGEMKACSHDVDAEELIRGRLLIAGNIDETKVAGQSRS
jgi:hypothetical protein